MADENSTPREPEEDAQPPAGAQPKPKRKPVSKGGIIVLIAAVALTVTIAWFWPQVSGRFILKTWSKGAPVDAVKELVAALQANDDAKVKAFSADGQLTTRVEDGKIVSIKLAADAMMPAYATEEVLPSSYEPTEAHRYRFDGELPFVSVTLPADGGWRICYTLTREGGKWLILSLDRVAPPGQLPSALSEAR